MTMNRVYPRRQKELLGLNVIIDALRINERLFSPDGRTITYPGSGNIQLRNLFSERQELTLDSGPVHQTFFSPDGSKIISVSISNGDVKVWDVQTRTELFTLIKAPEWIREPVFSPDGKAIMATFTQDYVRKLNIWEARSGKLLLTFDLQGLWEEHKQFDQLEVYNRALFGPDSQERAFLLYPGVKNDTIFRFWFSPRPLIEEVTRSRPISELLPAQIGQFELEDYFLYAGILDGKGTPAPLIREGVEEKMFNYADFFAMKGWGAGNPLLRRDYFKKAKQLYEAGARISLLHPKSIYRQRMKALEE